MIGEIRGADELMKHLQTLTDLKPIEEVVENNTKELETIMKKNAKFKGHTNSSGEFVSPTGATRDSIKSKVNGLEGSVLPESEIAIYLEYGTRYMSAQPFIRPSVDEITRKFKKDMDKLV